MKKLFLGIILGMSWIGFAQNHTYTRFQIDSICAVKNAKNVEILVANGDKKVLSDKQTASGSHTIKGKGSFKLLVYNLLEESMEIAAPPVEVEKRKNIKNKTLLKGQLESVINFTNGNFEKITATFYYQNGAILQLELSIQKKNGKEQSSSTLHLPGEDIQAGKLDENIVDGMPIADWIAKKNDEILNLFKK
ncbi:hypothetical protein [Flavobacterium stagni]|uniref:DUF4369 domain-containing protein n=1 Tax=Flavobacterium stagni TaxID=2506421 RepID=A0A4Q1K463_9FLAO|nr:hypothetical protein [Flavobacterium stagni]RXR20332.1 hypothetical protein EQG61_13010 [Flavobacterium stagni]